MFISLEKNIILRKMEGKRRRGPPTTREINLLLVVTGVLLKDLKGHIRDRSF